MHDEVIAAFSAANGAPVKVLCADDGDVSAHGMVVLGTAWSGLQLGGPHALVPLQAKVPSVAGADVVPAGTCVGFRAAHGSGEGRRRGGGSGFTPPTEAHVPGVFHV